MLVDYTWTGVIVTISRKSSTVPAKKGVIHSTLQVLYFGVATKTGWVTWCWHSANPGAHWHPCATRVWLQWSLCLSWDDSSISNPKISKHMYLTCDLIFLISNCQVGYSEKDKAGASINDTFARNTGIEVEETGNLWEIWKKWDCSWEVLWAVSRQTCLIHVWYQAYWNLRAGPGERCHGFLGGVWAGCVGFGIAQLEICKPFWLAKLSGCTGRS